MHVNMALVANVFFNQAEFLVVAKQTGPVDDAFLFTLTAYGQLILEEAC